MSKISYAEAHRRAAKFERERQARRKEVCDCQHCAVERLYIAEAIEHNKFLADRALARTRRKMMPMPPPTQNAPSTLRLQ